MSKQQVELEVKKPDSLEEVKAQLAVGTYSVWWVELCDGTYVSPWGGSNIDKLLKRFRGALNECIPAYEMLGYTTYLCVASEVQILEAELQIKVILHDIKIRAPQELSRYGDITFKYMKTVAGAEVLQCLSE